jgi:hypothetical protein
MIKEKKVEKINKRKIEYLAARKPGSEQMNTQDFSFT